MENRQKSKCHTNDIKFELAVLSALISNKNHLSSASLTRSLSSELAPTTIFPNSFLFFVFFFCPVRRLIIIALFLIEKVKNLSLIHFSSLLFSFVSLDNLFSFFPFAGLPERAFPLILFAANELVRSPNGARERNSDDSLLLLRSFYYSMNLKGNRHK